MIFRAILFAGTVSVSTLAGAAEVHHVGPGDFSWLHDPGQSLSPAQLSAPPWSERFESSPRSPGFGTQSSGTWLRITLPQRLQTVEDLWLHSPHHVYRQFCTYWPRLEPAGEFVGRCLTEDETREGVLGRLLQVPPGTNRQAPFYVFAASEIWLAIPLMLGPVPALMEAMNFTQTAYGLYFGVLLGAIVFCVLMGVLRRDGLFLLLALTLSIITLFLAFWDNRLASFAIGGVKAIRWIGPLGLLAVASGSLLAGRFLDVADHLPRAHKSMQALALLALLMAPAHGLFPVQLTPVVAVIFLVWPVLLAITAIQRLRAGFHLASYVLISMAVLMLTSVLGAFEALGLFLVDAQTITHGRYIGSLLMSGCLVAGIMDRVGRLTRERDEARTLAQSAQQLALHRAKYDEVSGLARRERLHEALAELMPATARTQPLIVFAIALKEFRTLMRDLDLNSGHQLCRDVADQLRTQLPQAELIARIGAAEFAWIMRIPADTEAAADRLCLDRCNALTEAFTQPLGRFAPRGFECAFGMARYPDHGQLSSDLLQAAELALEHAQKPGASSIQIFHRDLRYSAERRRKIMLEFDQALGSNLLELHYQPLVGLPRRSLRGAEALLRWPNATGGYHDNAEIMPIIEHSGESLNAFTAFSIATVGRQIAAWDQQGLWVPYVAINACSQQIQLPNFVEMITRPLVQHGIKPQRVVVEITEGSLLADLDLARARLGELRALGIRIAVDDFGVGYSSLSYLRELPVDILKIDRSFLARVPQDSESCAIVQGIVKLGHSLGLGLVAEGIETEAQARFLEEAGVKIGQGWLFSPAIAGKELGKLRQHAA